MNDPDVKTINDAIYLRGLFTQRYSGVEFALTELIMRARQHPAYQHLGDLPWRFAGKLERMRQLTESGPIAAYKDEMEAAFGDFTEFAERRHFLVHGIMSIPRDATDRATLGFRMYDHKKVTDEKGTTASVVHIGRMDATLSQLEELAEALQPMSSGFTALVARICREAPLPLLFEHVNKRTDQQGFKE